MRSWESQVEQKRGTDFVGFDRERREFAARPDGIFEFRVAIATNPNQVADANAVLLSLPSSDVGQLAKQIEIGISSADLKLYQGRFILPDAGGKDVAAQQFAPPGGEIALQVLAQALQRVADKAYVRIWPLYQVFDAATQSAQVSGFVAARIVRVIPPTQDQPLEFALQATVLVAPTALTDTDLGRVAASPSDNKYIAKVRRIE